jgi:hypothetical protein
LATPNPLLWWMVFIGTRQQPNTPNVGRDQFDLICLTSLGQDKSVTLCVTPWPDLFSPLQSPSVIPNFPASVLLSSLVGIIYHCEMNRELACTQGCHPPTRIHPKFCKTWAILRLCLLNLRGPRSSGLQRIPAGSLEEGA